MKIKLELFGASRDFSKKDYLEFNLKEKSSIKDLRHEILNFVENNFKGNQQVDIKSAVKKVEQALRSGEPVSVQDALLKWGNSVWSDDPPQGLEQIGDRIPKLKKGIKSLNSALYGSKQNEGTLEELKNDFYAIISNEIESKNKNTKNDLSPLYPK